MHMMQILNIAIYYLEEMKLKKESLYILDWGTGMNDKIIETCWMRIGTDDKLYNAKTESGRVKSGAKGIGRFALNRLGKKAEMLTFTKEGLGYDWKVNWSDFDRPGTSVSEITADIDGITLEEGHLFLSNLEKEFGISFPEFQNRYIAESNRTE